MLVFTVFSAVLSISARYDIATTFVEKFNYFYRVRYVMNKNQSQIIWFTNKHVFSNSINILKRDIELSMYIII